MTDQKKPEETTPLDTSKAVDPNGTSKDESTPIHDETDAALSAEQKVAPDAEPTEAHVTAEEPPTDPADDDDDLETAKSVKVDVERALARETQDGKGEEDPGPSDWNGYATEGVEEETGK